MRQVGQLERITKNIPVHSLPLATLIIKVDYYVKKVKKEYTGILYKDVFSEHIFFFFLLAQQPPVGQGLLIHEVSRSHTTTQVGWLCLEAVT